MTLRSIPAVCKTKNTQYVPVIATHRHAGTSDEFITLKQTIPNQFVFASLNISLPHQNTLVKKGIWPLGVGLWSKTSQALARGHAKEWIYADIAIFHAKRSPFRGSHVDKNMSSLLRIKNKNIDIAVETTKIKEIKQSASKFPLCNICSAKNFYYIATYDSNFVCKRCATADIFENVGEIHVSQKNHHSRLTYVFAFYENCKVHNIVDDDGTNEYMITDDNTCILKSCVLNDPYYDFNYEKIIIYKDII